MIREAEVMMRGAVISNCIKPTHTVLTVQQLCTRYVFYLSIRLLEHK